MHDCGVNVNFVFQFVQVSLGTKLKSLTIKRHSRVYDLSSLYRFVQMRGPNLKGFAEMAVAKREVFSTPHTSTSANQSSKVGRSLEHADNGSQSTAVEGTHSAHKEMGNGGARWEGRTSHHLHGDSAILHGADGAYSGERAQVEHHPKPGSDKRTQRLGSGSDRSTQRLDSGPDTVKRSPRVRGSHSESEAAGSVSGDSGSVRTRAGKSISPENTQLVTIWPLRF